MASASAYSEYGNYVFVATMGTQSIEIVDAYSNQHFGSILTNGFSPQGLVLSSDGTQLFVHNFLSRSVTVFAIDNLCNGICGVAQQLADVSTVASESLTAQVLQGKQIFYNTADLRMSRDNYISCASCHLDGEHDGRTWDFTDRGEGLRNTPTLDGRSGMAHGRVHWSGNFDEIQGFEHDIRGPFGGTGFMTDADFLSENRNRSLGGAKAGFSAELDALAAYVTSLSSVPKSPHRTSNGNLTASVQQGEILFGNRCSTCHSGSSFTDSSFAVLHDVGTIGDDSGQRLGKKLGGIDTPGLRGAWATAPYLHDGSAATFLEVLTSRNTMNQHGMTSDLDSTQLQALVDYLQQLDDRSTSFTIIPPTPDPDSDDDGMLNVYEDANGLNPYVDDASADADTDGLTNLEEYNLGTDPNNPDTDGDGLPDKVENNNGTYAGPSSPGTDPLNPDSDNDSFSDSVELAAGSDPLDAASTPTPTNTITAVSEINGEPEGVTATYQSGNLFNEDTPVFTDRTHQYNGVTASGPPPYPCGTRLRANS